MLLTSLPAVLYGLDGVLGCGSGEDMDPVLAVSGSRRAIQGNETLQVYKSCFSMTSVLKPQTNIHPFHTDMFPGFDTV